jgi:hypothetical protein
LQVLAILFLIQDAVLLCYYTPRALEEHRINTQENWVEKVPRFSEFFDNSYLRLQLIFQKCFNVSDSMKTALILFNTFYWTSGLLLGILLFYGAKQRDLRKCRQWFIVSCILTVMFIVDVMMQAMTSSVSELASPVAAIFLLTYMIWVVLSFIDEIRLGRVPIKTQSEIPA